MLSNAKSNEFAQSRRAWCAWVLYGNRWERKWKRKRTHKKRHLRKYNSWPKQTRSRSNVCVCNNKLYSFRSGQWWRRAEREKPKIQFLQTQGIQFHWQSIGALRWAIVRVQINPLESCTGHSSGTRNKNCRLSFDSILSSFFFPISFLSLISSLNRIDSSFLSRPHQTYTKRSLCMCVCVCVCDGIFESLRTLLHSQLVYDLFLTFCVSQHEHAYTERLAYGTLTRAYRWRWEMLPVCESVSNQNERTNEKSYEILQTQTCFPMEGNIATRER